jgi:hypothetical protein
MFGVSRDLNVTGSSLPTWATATTPAALVGPVPTVSAGSGNTLDNAGSGVVIARGGRRRPLGRRPNNDHCSASGEDTLDGGLGRTVSKRRRRRPQLAVGDGIDSSLQADGNDTLNIWHAGAEQRARSQRSRLHRDDQL